MVDEKDKKAWLNEVADVKPLDDKKRDVEPWEEPEQPPKKDKPPQKEPLFHKQKWQPTVPKQTFTLDEISHVRIAGRAGGVDERTRRKLASGKIEWTAATDLHGMTLEQAYERLMGFLLNAYNGGHRCVLVIHGKGSGYGEGGRMGAIKSQVGKWLANVPYVLAFDTAVPKDGGSGAMYVLLKRKR